MTPSSSYKPSPDLTTPSRKRVTGGVVDACVWTSGVDEQAGVRGPRGGVLHREEPPGSPASAAFIHAYGLEG
eukprot:5938033-Prymnesium_polylepis.1